MQSEPNRTGAEDQERFHEAHIFLQEFDDLYPNFLTHYKEEDREAALDTVLFMAVSMAVSIILLMIFGWVAIFLILLIAWLSWQAIRHRSAEKQKRQEAMLAHLPDDIEARLRNCLSAGILIEEQAVDGGARWRIDPA